MDLAAPQPKLTVRAGTVHGKIHVAEAVQHVPEQGGKLMVGYNLIWIIMDRLTKSVHFIPVSTTYKVQQYTELYISYIVRYHGIPKTIISNR
jgi:hypothetical protein